MTTRKVIRSIPIGNKKAHIAAVKKELTEARTKARKTGYELWVNVNYRSMALDVAERLKNERPASKPAVGYLPLSNSYVVWHKPRIGQK